MNARIVELNGIFIRYRLEDGREDIDDSTFDEIINKKKGDVIELSPSRVKALEEL